MPVETFAITAAWDPWRELLDVWASIQMPKYADQIARAMRLPANAVRVHQDIDVGGSYGVKRGIKHTVLCGYLTRRLGRPVRLIEDRLENMRGGDAHGPERIFDVSLAFNSDGIIRSMKMRALDNVGAYAGRAPFQLGKPIGAIVGPYQDSKRRISRPSPSPPTRRRRRRCAASARRRPITPSKPAIDRRRARRWTSTASRCAGATSSARTSFPISIPSGTTYDSGDYHAVVDKAFVPPTLAPGRAERDAAACRRTARRHRRSPSAWSPAAATRPSSRCSIPKTRPRPGWKSAASCRWHRRHHRHRATPPVVGAGA